MSASPPTKDALSAIDAWVLDASKPSGVRYTELPWCEPADEEVCIALQAAALNHRDLWCIQGKYPNLREGCVLGSDGAGKVMACGKGVADSWIGRSVIINPNKHWGPNKEAQGDDYEILGMPSNGTLASHICLPVDRIHAQPQHMSATQAAALPLAMLTAWRALVERGRLKAKEKLLITGIGGGVALMALQLAVAYGAEVYVTSSSRDKISKALDMGAKGGACYGEDNWIKQLSLSGVDMVLDSGGGQALNDYLSLLVPAGRLVIYGATAGVPQGLGLQKLFWKQVSVLGSTMGDDAAFADALDFVEKHRIAPVVDAVYGLDELEQALARMKEGAQMGKIVLRPLTASLEQDLGK